MTDPNCPSCGTPLEEAESSTGRRWQCRTCRGVVITVAVFRRVLTEGVGSQVWVGSATQPTDGRPCGFCGRSMRPTRVPPSGDHEAQVEVCRICEAIWVPADQAVWLPLRAAVAGAPLALPLAATPPTRCPECGAPFAVAEDGCCPYCHRRVEAAPVPEVLVMFSHDDAHDEADPLLRTLGGAALFALGALLGR